MNRIFFALVLSFCTLPAFAADQPPAVKPAEQKGDLQVREQDHPSVFMKKKLDYSQNILAGITHEDFDLIADNARAMKGLGRIEAFVRSRNAAYTRQLQTFEDINDEIIRQADKDNLEGVALAFNQLTTNCVSCHKVLRLHEQTAGKK